MLDNVLLYVSELIPVQYLQETPVESEQTAQRVLVRARSGEATQDGGEDAGCLT